MPRLVQDHRLLKREQRLKLEIRRKPYWVTLNEGEHLGYYRGARVGKWLVRFRQPGSRIDYQQATLGEADDYCDADGAVILDYRQAQGAARRWITALERNEGRKVGKYTVNEALDDYLVSFRGKDLSNTRRRIEKIVRPQMGHYEVAKLSSKIIADWHRSLAEAPAMLRSAKGADQNYRETADTEDARRRRRSSANRILTILKAALNVAYRDGRASADDAWRRVKAFPMTEVPRVRYLTNDDARRLTHACEEGFRPLVQAALLTGARYSELSRLVAEDFDLQGQTVWLRETKSGKQRTVFLSSEGVRLFNRATAGKPRDALIFPRPDGKQWGASQQARPMAAACKNAGIDPTNFHDLRRTYGAQLALAGVQLAVIAEAMGHADERITRRHYAHLSKSYVGDTIREAMTGRGLVEESNIERLELTKPSSASKSANIA